MSIIIKKKKSTPKMQPETKVIIEKLKVAKNLAEGLDSDFQNLKQTLLNEKEKILNQ